MLKFTANLTFLFKEYAFLNRFREASEAGFQTVEFMFPYDFGIDQLKNELDRNQLKLILFNLPAGDWENGDRGIANNPSQKGVFRQDVGSAITYASALGVKQINCLVGKNIPGISEAVQRETLVENLRCAADEFGNHDINLLLEFINNYDIPGFYLNNTEKALGLISEIDRPNVYLQYDVYHAQRVEGELINTLIKHMSKIAHIQVADNPGRHQPGTGEINYPAVFEAINKSGYQGYIGLEYNPKRETKESFEWVANFGLSL
jgi:hydroxypyruvate isomerase